MWLQGFTLFARGAFAAGGLRDPLEEGAARRADADGGPRGDRGEVAAHQKGSASAAAASARSSWCGGSFS